MRYDFFAVKEEEGASGIAPPGTEAVAGAP
jgi:hypothetical protein